MQVITQLLRYGQSYLVYPAGFQGNNPRYVEYPSRYGLPCDDLELQTSDGITLRCYLLRLTNELLNSEVKNETEQSSPTLNLSPNKALGTVIMCHGNATDHGDCIWAAKKFFKRHYHVFMLSYRGYGHSGGVPSEKGLRIDAQTALDFILADPELSQIPIILYGQSLGGAVVIDLASRNPTKVNALIIENTFTSIPDLVRGWPYIGRFSFLCTQRWSSASKIRRIPATVPILMLSGYHDEVVPRAHMHKLWELAVMRGDSAEGAKNSDIRDVFEEFAYGTHSDTSLCSGYWTVVRRFLKSLAQPTLVTTPLAAV